MTSPARLDDLMVFHEVLLCGGMSSASAKLGIAKSTISRSLARLEEGMGTLLIKRSTRRLAPTEVGREVFARCEAIAGELALVRSATEQSRSKLQGTLRVSMPNEFGSAWLGAAISEFAIRFPELRLEIDVNTHSVDLIAESYDVALHFGQLKSSGFIYRRLATLPRGLYASPEYLARAGAIRTPEDLRAHPFVITDVQKREAAFALRGAGGRHTIKMVGRIAVNSMRLARELVVGGAGIGLLPNRMSDSYVASGRLEQLLPQWQAPAVQAGATVLAREGISYKTRLFLDFIAERLAQPSSPATRTRIREVAQTRKG
jgi:DNA-binding transcriptional LysR family regulator